jgi:prepilin-type N-terminal cleavage/methylation domain-containing protein
VNVRFSSAVRRGRIARPRRGGATERGYSLIELLFVSALLAVIAAATVPQSLVMIDRSRAFAAARYLSARMSQARIGAVGRTATVALRFDQEPAGTTFRVFVDGNGNGVRTRDIGAGVDRQIEDPVLLGDMFPGVTIGLSPALGDEAVQLGGDLLSFTPSGTATSGSIYIRGRDGSQFVVRVLGATGRSRVLRYDPARFEWVDALW